MVRGVVEEVKGYNAQEMECYDQSNWEKEFPLNYRQTLLGSNCHHPVMLDDFHFDLLMVIFFTETTVWRR